MRDKSHMHPQRGDVHNHWHNGGGGGGNLAGGGADGLDAWFYQQKQRDKELRQRRAEAEALLRGYRGGRESLGGLSHSNNNNHHNHYSNHNTSRDSLGGDSSVAPHHLTIDAPGGAGTGDSDGNDRGPPSLRASTSTSDSLDDPRSFHSKQRRFAGPGDAPGAPSPDTLGVMRKNRGSVDARNSAENAADDPLSEKRATAPSAPDDHDDDASALEEPVTVWLDFVEPGGRFPPAAHRYHLYLSYACPGSHRALIVRALKGLADSVAVTYVHPTWRLTNPADAADKHRGWVFGQPGGAPFANTIQRGGPFPAAYPGTDPDPLFNAYSVRELYEQAGDTSGKYTVPLLWDTVHNTIVNNESSDIAYMLNSCFNDYCRHPDLDLYTEYDEEGVAKLNEVSEWLSPLMIHGVYRCGFAKNQRAYDKAIADLCDAFDRADDVLQKQRYLTGNDMITDGDIRLFVSLLRFDEVYAVYFKANARLVMLTPALLNFCREMYQRPGVADTCQMDQIKAHFFGSHAEWNKYSVIPRGLGFVELLDMPHDRHLLADDPFDDHTNHPFNNDNHNGRGDNDYNVDMDNNNNSNHYDGMGDEYNTIGVDNNHGGLGKVRTAGDEI